MPDGSMGPEKGFRPEFAPPTDHGGPPEKKGKKGGVERVQSDIDLITRTVSETQYRIPELRDLLSKYQGNDNIQARTLIRKEIDRLESGGKEGTIAEKAHEEFDRLGLYSGNPRELSKAADRWLRAFEGKPGVSGVEIKQAKEWFEAGLSQEGMAVVEAKNEDEKEKLRMKIRKAMIEQLEVTKVGESPNFQGFDTFIATRAREEGPYKTRFSDEIQKPFEEEYNARVELAKAMVYWDGSPDMDEGSLKGMPVLSRSTYEWLSKKKENLRYELPVLDDSGKEIKDEKGKVVTEIEIVEELRKRMDTVASDMYLRMMLGALSVWEIRGEDRLKKYELIAKDLGVPIDAVRLTWQLAEAECWQARMKVGFTSHKACKLVKFAEYRDFYSRKALPNVPVPGGTRLWSEYLRENKNTYPPKGTDVYGVEGGRLARVGFEAWSIKVDEEEVDPRGERFRKGQVWLFSESGAPLDPPKELLNIRGKTLEIGQEEIEAAINEFKKPERLLKAIKNEDDREAAKKELDSLKKVFLATVGGERALLAGKYFSTLDAFLAQPGIVEVDLPQRQMKDDMVRSAGVMKSIEAFGEIDATKASTANLAALRNALVGLFFRFQSNDLERNEIVLNGKKEDDKVRKIKVSGKDKGRNKVYVEKKWYIDNGAQERNAKARIRVGELMEEWTRSYVWLLSWANYATGHESKVVGMRDWINLARAVARDYDENHQWGEFVGFGYGNFDGNELAIENDAIKTTGVDGKEKLATTQRIGATDESKVAAERYVRWFDAMYKVNKDIVVNAKRTMSTKRRGDDMEDLGLYPFIFFWRNRWW